MFPVWFAVKTGLLGAFQFMVISIAKSTSTFLFKPKWASYPQQIAAGVAFLLEKGGGCGSEDVKYLFGLVDIVWVCFLSLFCLKTKFLKDEPQRMEKTYIYIYTYLDLPSV